MIRPLYWRKPGLHNNFYKSRCQSSYSGLILDMGFIGPILVIIIVGAVYLFFSKHEAAEAEHAADIHVRKTLANVEMEKLKTQQEELRLKKEFFEYEKARIGRGDKSLEATYTVKDAQLEDKSKDK